MAKSLETLTKELASLRADLDEVRASRPMRGPPGARGARGPAGAPGADALPPDDFLEAVADQTLFFPRVTTQATLDDAIYRALNATARSNGGEGAIIRLPPGDVELTSSLRFGGIRGLRIEGAGRDATRLVWAGPDDVPAVEFDQCNWCGLENLTMYFQPGVPCLEAIRTTDTRTNNGSHPLSKSGLRSEGMKFVRLFIDAGNPAAVLLGGWNNKLGTVGGGKNDQHVGEHLHIRGCTDYLLSIEGQAARNIHLFNPVLQGLKVGDSSFFCKVGIRSNAVPGQGGSAFVFGGVIMNNLRDLEFGDRSGPWGFLLTWFEQSKQWMRALNYRAVDGSQAEYLNVKFMGARWASRSAEYINPIVDVRVAGFSWDDCMIGLTGEDKDYEIYVEPVFPDPEAFDVTNSRIGGLRSKPFGIFTARYPHSTKGTKYSYGSTASGSQKLSQPRDRDYLVPAYETDWYARGLRRPRAYQCFEDKTRRTAWAPDTTYELHAEVSNNNRHYQCSVAGVSASSGGPTTTGTVITDGTCEWRYIGEGEGVCYDRQTGGDRQFHLHSTAGVVFGATDTEWDGPCAGFTEVADQGLHYNDDENLLDPNDRAVLYAGLCHLVSVSADNRIFATLGDASGLAGAHGPFVRCDGTGKLRAVVNGSEVTTAGGPSAGVWTGKWFAYAILWDPDQGANGTLYLQIYDKFGNDELISIAATGPVGSVIRKGLGSPASSRSSPVMRFRLHAMWTDADAAEFAGAPSLLALCKRIAARPAPATVAPTAGFTAADEQLLATLTDTSVDGSNPIDTWLVDWGDGATSTGAGPWTHTYAAAGVYSVSLTVTDSTSGLSDGFVSPVTIRAVQAATHRATAKQTAPDPAVLTFSGYPALGAGSLILVSAASDNNSAVQYPTVAGGGLTWVLDPDAAQGFTATALTKRGVAVLRGLGVPDGSDITVTWPAAQLSAIAHLDEITGVAQTGSDGEDAVRNPTPAQITSGALTITGTLPTLEHPNNGHFYAVATSVAQATTPGSGFAELGDDNTTANAISLETGWKRNDTTAAPSWASSAQAGIVSLETVSA